MKDGCSYVDTVVSSYDEAYAVASSLGYDLYTLHNDSNGTWFYAITVSGNHGDAGAMDTNMNNTWLSSGFSRVSKGDNVVYMQDSLGGNWRVTIWYLR